MDGTTFASAFQDIESCLDTLEGLPRLRLLLARRDIHGLSAVERLAQVAVELLELAVEVRIYKAKTGLSRSMLVHYSVL